MLFTLREDSYFNRTSTWVQLCDHDLEMPSAQHKVLLWKADDTGKRWFIVKHLFIVKHRCLGIMCKQYLHSEHN